MPEALRKALEAVTYSQKGRGKGTPGGTPKPKALDVFKAHCTTLGVKFVESRFRDYIDLFAAIRARCADVA